LNFEIQPTMNNLTNPLFEGLSNLPPISDAFITTSSSASASNTDSSLDIELISQLRGSRAIREEDIEAQQESGTASFDSESLAQYHALVSKGKIESIGISPSAQEAEEAVEKYLESYWESKTSLASLAGLEQEEEGGGGEHDVVDDTKPINRFVTIRSSDGLLNKGGEVEIEDEETSVEDSRDQLGSLWDASSPLRSPFSSLPQYLGSAEKIDGDFRERRDTNDDSSPLRSLSPTEVRRNLLAFSSESPTQNYEQAHEEQAQRSRKPPSSKRAPIVSSRISGSGGVRVLGPFEDDSDVDIASPLERVAHNLLHLLIDEGPVVGAGGPVADDLDASGAYARVDDKSNALLVSSSLPQGSSPLDPIIAKGGDKKTTELLSSSSLAFDPVFESLRTPDARADYSRLIRKGRLIDEAHSDPRPLQQTPL